MKTSPYALPAAAIALLTAAIFAVTTVAQNSQAPQPPAGSTPMAMQHDHDDAPTNLKVLPKNLTDEQVHGIMRGWAAALGTHCTTCHTADPNKMGPNGRPQLNFADDSKPEKATARLMFSMTENINMNYVSKIPDSDAKVGCGTCHRGHLEPEPFVAPPENHDGPPPQGAPQGPPAGAAPPTSH